jgi:hypothetical protein
MKASLLTSVLLMSALTVSAQPSRRDNGERRGQHRNDNHENQYRSDNSRNVRSEGNGGNFREFRTVRDEHRSTMYYDSRRIGNDRNWNDNRSFNRREWADRGRDYHQYHGAWRRPILVSHYSYRSEPLEIRRVHYPLFAPVRASIFWTNSMLCDFRLWYPEVHVWRYPIGYRILSISAYDSYNYVGEVANVYGRVIETYYNSETDEYYLYLGDRFPYQDFSVVIPGYEARRFSRDPEYYFANTNVAVTGYIENTEGKPEIQIRRSSQISVY